MRIVTSSSGLADKNNRSAKAPGVIHPILPVIPSTLAAADQHVVLNTVMALTSVAGGLFEDGRAGKDLGTEIKLAELERLHRGEGVGAIRDVHADFVCLLERHVAH